MAGIDRPRYGRRRAAVLVGVHLFFAAHFLHWKLAGKTLAPLELNEVLHTLHGGIVTVGFLFMVVALLATLVWGRYFCSWGCHMLAVQDAVAWLLSKAGLRPRPVRSPALAGVSWIALFYLVVWPQLARLAAGRPHPGLRVLTDADGWASFVTSDLTRNLPGPGIALLTFLVGAGLLVYLLGSRSFCYAACPYGALFRAADRAAPGRILLAGHCTACGVCTQRCRSHVGVHEEVARYSAVVDPACLKCMACVEACPTGALRFGLAKPLLLRRGAKAAAARLRPSLTRREDLVFGTVTLAAFLSYRGLYGWIPFLLALSAAVLAGWGAVVGLRLASRRDVEVQGRRLKDGGRLSAWGRAVACAVFAGVVLTAHSGYVRYHEWRAELLCRRLSAGPFLESEARAAREHLRKTLDAGLLKPLPARGLLAKLELRLGRPEAAQAQLRAILSERPGDPESALRMAGFVRGPKLSKEER